MLEIGQIIDGKYKILNVIGKGGMSVVYLAMNERANKQWAIKEVRKDGTQDFNVVRQGLVAEIDMLKRFNHPNLPSIVDVIDGNGSFLIVMDYIEGIALDKKLQEEGALPQSSVIEWSKQLCDVLGYLHSRKPPIIYRDMKPANVMLKPDNTITLIDFGTAREFKLSSVEDTTVLGTRGYAAPEQYGGQGQTDPRTDIYCLGATMYHLVTGYNPAVPPYEMVPIRQINELLSSGLEAIILKCTRPNPPDRYQSCAELMYALEHYQELDAESQHIQNVKWRSFIAAASLAVVTLIGGVGFNIAKNIQTNSSYESYVDTAATAPYEEKIKLYQKAIALRPEKYEAYSELINVLDNDDVIDATEYEIFEKAKVNISELKKENPEKYTLLSYDYATALLFDYYEGDTYNQKVAASKSLVWFGNADEKLIESAAEKAGRDYKRIQSRKEILHSLARFLDSSSKVTQEKCESNWAEYERLFNDEELINNTGDYKTVISIYNIFVCDVLNNQDMYRSSYTSEDIDERLKDIENQLPQLSGYANEKRAQLDKIENISTNIENIRKYLYPDAQNNNQNTEGGTVQ